MRNALNEKKYFVIWGIGICASVCIYMYALADIQGYVENYQILSAINVLPTFVIAIANIVALQKCITVVDEICKGNDKPRNALIVIMLTGLTLGIYGHHFLKGQLERIENKFKEYGHSIETKAMLSWYIGWIAAIVFLAFGTYGAGEITTYEDLQSNMGARFFFQVIQWGIFVGFVKKYVSIINDLIAADNSYKQNREESDSSEEKNPDNESKTNQEREEIEKQRELEEQKKKEIEEQRQKEINEKIEKEKQDEIEKRQKAEEPVTQIDRSLWHYSLLCLEGEYEGMDIPLEEDEFVMLGRNAAVVNIVFSNASVSGLHCQVRYSVEDDCFQVADFSSYGTYINDLRIEKGDLIDCPPGSILDLGKTGNRFRLVAERHL